NGAALVCSIIEQRSQFAHQPCCAVRAVEWQDPANSQSRGTRRIVRLIETRRRQQLRARGPKGLGQGADSSLVDHGGGPRKYLGIRQVLKGGDRGWQRLLDRHPGQQQAPMAERLAGGDCVLPETLSQPDRGGSQRKHQWWRTGGEKTLEPFLPCAGLQFRSRGIVHSRAADERVRRPVALR